MFPSALLASRHWLALASKVPLTQAIHAQTVSFYFCQTFYRSKSLERTTGTQQMVSLTTSHTLAFHSDLVWCFGLVFLFNGWGPVFDIARYGEFTRLHLPIYELKKLVNRWHVPFLVSILLPSEFRPLIEFHCDWSRWVSFKRITIYCSQWAHVMTYVIMEMS